MTDDVRYEIEFTHEYLRSRDMTIILEDVYISKGNDKLHARERICGFYHGEPNKEDTQYFLDKGCEGIIDDDGLLLRQIAEE